MQNMDSLVTWQPSQLLIAGLVVVVVNMSLGFSLWKALSHSLWTPMTVGILMTLGGAAINAIHYMSLYRNPNNHHRHA